MNNIGRVYFGLRGDFIPDEVTSFIGIKPTSSQKEGEKDPVRNIPRCSLWQYSSETINAEVVDVFQLSDWVIEKLTHKQKEIKQAVLKWDLHATLEVVLEIAVDEEVRTPAIGFNPKVIQFLADIGADIDIDTYRNYE
jgi:D-mannonate dehydratase